MCLKNNLLYGLKSVRYHGAKLWNALPVEFRNAPSKTLLKTQLKIRLLMDISQDSLHLERQLPNVSKESGSCDICGGVRCCNLEIFQLA